jgi:hypothetical protein
LTFTWVVSSRVPAGDFSSPVEDLVRNYLRAEWSISDPAMGVLPIPPAPPTDLHDKIRLGDFDFDGFSTYYIKVKEGVTTIDNEQIMSGLYGFQTPIIFTLSARRLSKGQQFQQLNNMRLEVIRIIGQYNPDDISGIPGFQIVDPGDVPSPTTIRGQQSIWWCEITANVIYHKHVNIS